MLFVQKALDLMSLVPKRCNDMMNLGRLQGYEVHLVIYRRLSFQFVFLTCQSLTKVKICTGLRVEP